MLTILAMCGPPMALFIEGLQELFGLRPASQDQVSDMARGHKKVENHCSKLTQCDYC